MKFKVGDTVKFGGILGKVVSIDLEAHNYYPIKVVFENNGSVDFTIDGRYHINHTESLLIFVKREPVKEVTYRIDIFINGSTTTYSGFETREKVEYFLKTSKYKDFEIIKITTQYEVEE